MASITRTQTSGRAGRLESKACGAVGAPESISSSEPSDGAGSVSIATVLAPGLKELPLLSGGAGGRAGPAEGWWATTEGGWPLMRYGERSVVQSRQAALFGMQHCKPSSHVATTPSLPKES